MRWWSRRSWQSKWESSLLILMRILRLSGRWCCHMSSWRWCRRWRDYVEHSCAVICVWFRSYVVSGALLFDWWRCYKFNFVVMVLMVMMLLKTIQIVYVFVSGWFSFQCSGMLLLLLLLLFVVNILIGIKRINTIYFVILVLIVVVVVVNWGF